MLRLSLDSNECGDLLKGTWVARVGMLSVAEASSLTSEISTRRALSWRPVERYQRPRLAVSLHHKGDRATPHRERACCHSGLM